MELTAQQIQENWIKFLEYIEKYITGERKEQLLEFYKSLEDRIIIYPAANMVKYHSCFPGGYIYHVNRVIKSSIYIYKVWGEMGADLSNFTLEELIFSAINHDLGKIGDLENEAYQISTDKWRKDNLGELYTFNTNLQFMSVPDRGLFLLQEQGIKISQNEFIAIKTHDGLYDNANESYIKPFIPEARFRTCMPYILHQADLLSAAIEFQQDYQKLKNIK